MQEFILELIKRYALKTPKFFKVLQVIAIITAFLTGLPLLLETSGIVLPKALSVLSSKVVSISSMVAAFVAQLTVVVDEQYQLKK